MYGATWGYIRIWDSPKVCTQGDGMGICSSRFCASGLGFRTWRARFTQGLGFGV